MRLVKRGNEIERRQRLLTSPGLDLKAALGAMRCQDQNQDVVFDVHCVGGRPQCGCDRRQIRIIAALGIGTHDDRTAAETVGHDPGRAIRLALEYSLIAV
jgi:hypothetical protein